MGPSPDAADTAGRPMRWAVLGDVGGQAEALAAELSRLGVDVAAARLPEDLTIVQVGDLVHRGSGSEEVVALVDRLLAANEGRWVQLIGNHEAQYVRPPSFRWPQRLSSTSARIVRDWWGEGRMRVAAVVPTARGGALVTHAGVTQGFWRFNLISPPTAQAAAARLDDLARQDADELFRPGALLTGSVNHRAGPLWAESARELVASWEGHEMPFDQVHGHSRLFGEDGAWRAGPDVQARTVLDLDAGHETTTMLGGIIVGIDPGHGELARDHWRAWEPDGQSPRT